MYCTKCGAPIKSGDKFCVKCGNKLKSTTNSTSSTKASGAKSTGKGSSAAKGKANDNQPLNAAQGLVYTLVVAGLALFIAYVVAINSSCDAANGLKLSSCNSAEQTSQTIVTGADVSTADNNQASVPQDETAGTTADTTTTTTTTTTTANLKLEEAKRIRALLPANKWSTKFLGYNATVTFKNDGTAVIAIKVGLGPFSVTEKVDATYSVSDDCRFTLRASYSDKNYKFTGDVKADSDKQITVSLDGGDKLTLTAA